MPQLGQGQTGKLKSMPKLTHINGDDYTKVIYRNLGNNHAYPFVWGNTAVMVSGTSEVTVASGIKWHSFELASYATVVATPEGELGYLTVEKDKVNNVIKIKSSAAASGDTNINMMFMLGAEMEVTGFNSPGDYGATQSLP